MKRTLVLALTAALGGCYHSTDSSVMQIDNTNPAIVAANPVMSRVQAPHLEDGIFSYQEFSNNRGRVNKRVVDYTSAKGRVHVEEYIFAQHDIRETSVDMDLDGEFDFAVDCWDYYGSDGFMHKRDVKLDADANNRYGSIHEIWFYRNERRGKKTDEIKPKGMSFLGAQYDPEAICAPLSKDPAEFALGFKL